MNKDTLLAVVAFLTLLFGLLDISGYPNVYCPANGDLNHCWIEIDH